MLRPFELWFTYGPRTDNDEALKDLFRAGATGARLTFSYGTADLQLERAGRVRAAGAAVGVQARIVADLAGGKLRLAKVGDLAEIPVGTASSVVLLHDSTGADLSMLRLPVQNSHLISRLSPGDVLIEGDGEFEMEVVGVGDEGATCRPMEAGVLRPGRGLAVRSATFTPVAMTTKDRADLRVICESGLFDAVALSFVANASDIEEARELTADRCAGVSLIAKVELQAALDNLDAICDQADAVMAARGDLALTRHWSMLPGAVDQIASAAERHGKPWILATQIFEGLERFAFPTRAEICDVANWLGNRSAGGAMLTFETAFGSRGRDAVAALEMIRRHVAG